MSYDPEDPHQSADGKRFAHPMQARARDRWLDEQDRAPGGLQHEQDRRLHGSVSKLTIEREGNGRSRVTATHGDGFTHTSVHPEAYRAHEVAAHLLDIEPPPAVSTHGRARSHPTGPKEEERVRHEDGRDDQET